MMQEKINYGGWPNCIRLYNDEIELIVTTDIGPRIIRLGFIDMQNFFYQSTEDGGKVRGKDWRIYGGHRLWLAPEAIPLSYHPDNEPVNYIYNGGTLTLTQAKETTSGMVKEMEITLSPGKNNVTVLHRLINHNMSEIETSPWAISAMAPYGRAIIPQEPYGAGDDYLLPARPLSLWHYTKMNDSRWIWGDKYIQAIQDPAKASEQKIGVLNKEGWTAYCLNGELLIKKFDYKPGAVYPDFGCNNETYINGNLLEIETLGPLTKIHPGGVVEHRENWLLCKAEVDKIEKSIDENILPIVESFKK
ncbi:MAG: hypothetical protein ABIO76_11435 [Ginsengibacter sp.]